MNEIENYLIRFWAKTSPDKEKPNAFHPLICHLIDVAVVTQKIWQDVLPTATKERIAKTFGETNCDKETFKKVGLIIAFIAGLHDLGKCSPPFTLRGLHENKQTKDLLKLYCGTPFEMSSVSPSREAPHGYVTAVELPQILEDFGFNQNLAKQICILIGGHHGIFPSSQKLNNLKLESFIGNKDWKNARRKLTETLTELLNIKPFRQSENSKLDNGTIMILAGLVSVADWIGSDTQFFECAIKDFTSDFDLDLDEYLKHSETQAETALKQLGWLDWAEIEKPKKFFELFPKLEKYPLRGLQTEAIEIAKELKTQGIVVIESPMGEGKTEAAMFLADYFNAILHQRGIYFALPTQATSNQMFGRVNDFLGKRFKKGNLQTQSLHGHSSLSAEFDTLKENFQNIQGVYEECTDGNCVPHVVAAEWFTYRKRGLLAPFGVGTIDQALMAVLQTKHVFVRLFGLAHKTVIIDEVHAYDAYMSTLLERLLEWLAALGSPVILLSATLPIERRNKLIEAYQKGLGVGTDKIQEAKYPRISYATDSTIKVRHINSSAKNQTLHIKKVDENFVAGLKAKLEKEDGCVAIICNTVKRSQDIYEQLSQDEFFKGNADDGLPKLDLLHSRFRFCDRDAIEKRVRLRFGKKGEKVRVSENGEEIEKEVERPDFAVLVSTQIIEQSLDIDFDLMISDLAPIDLLLQRAGRLHRHDRERKDEFKDATLWIIEPKIKDDGLPNFENSIVYDDHILLRTWLELNKKEYEKIEIPNEIEDLIEAVYSEENAYGNLSDELKRFWDKTLKDYNDGKKEEIKEAEARWIGMPNAPQELYKIVGGQKDQLEEDSLTFFEKLRALTRLNADSLTVICLYNEADKAFLEPNNNKEVDYINVISGKKISEDEKRIITKTLKLLLGNSLSINRKDLILALLKSKETEIPTEWKKSPLLRSCRVLWLDDDSTVEITNDGGEFFIHLHPKIGLKVRYFKN